MDMKTFRELKTEGEAKSVYRRMFEIKLASHQSATFDIKEKLNLLDS